MAAQAETGLPVHRIDVETYNRIVASGALEGQRVELLEGLLVEMSPRSPAHAVVVMRLARHLSAATDLWTRVQDPIEVGERCEPEPDVLVLGEEPSSRRHPRTGLLVIEVAVTSQLIDRNVKARHYARAGIPVYWLVDVPGRSVEVRTGPGAGEYERCEVYGDGSVVPCALEGVEDLDVAALLAGVEA